MQRHVKKARDIEIWESVLIAGGTHVVESKADFDDHVRVSFKQEPSCDRPMFVEFPNNMTVITFTAPALTSLRIWYASAPGAEIVYHITLQK